jgi:hypothetical protein
MYMTKMKLMDKYEAVQALLRGETVENFSVEDAQAFLDERKELVARKNATGGERKPTKTQLENVGIKAMLLSTMAQLGVPTSAGDIQKANDELSAYSGQKLTSLLTQMVKEGSAVRTEAKGKAYFAVA